MVPFKNLLVPVDFSKHSERALEAACELAKAFGSSLTVFHAYTIPTYPLPEGYVFPSAEAVTEILEKTQAAITDARVFAEKLGAPRVDAVVAEGIAFAEIVRAARERNVDLIVMGTHGRTGLKHALLGSVAEKVVRKAPCAVLTVRDPELKFEQP
jgi:nucleotide-binding universal stress UspA family protein